MVELGRIKAIVVKSGPTNYVQELRKYADLVKFIENETADDPGLPFKARVYRVISGEPRICPAGKERPFINIIKGWGYCGRTKSCSCLSQRISEATKEKRAAEKQAAITADTNVIDDYEAKKRLVLLMDENPRGLARIVLKNPALHQWVIKQSEVISTEQTKFAERVFVAVHGTSTAFCHRGKKRLFKNVNEGYWISCEDDRRCACRREAQASSLSESCSNLDDGERVRRNEAQVATIRKRYGVDNAALISGAADRARETSMKRYGAPHHMQSPEGLQRHGDAFEEKYGVRSPGASQEIQDKARKTNLERYGVEHTMDRARSAFIEQSKFTNPFNDPVIAAKAEASMIRNHGVVKALQSPIIIARMRDKLMMKHGVENVMQLQEIRDKLRTSNIKKYGRISPGQAHFSDETYAILNDGALFKELFQGRSLRDVSVFLDIGYDTARKYCYKHGVELPKSSYEIALSDFIVSLGFDRSEVRNPDRTIIKPMELDIVVDRIKLAIEFHGLYYHSGSHIDRNYHRSKMLLTEAQGYRLITIFEDEWVHQQDIVKSRLAHSLGKSPRGPGARSCKIQRILPSEANVFLDQYHIQGGRVFGYVNYGAFFQGKLVAVMTFSKGRLGVGSGRMELLRFATDGRNMPGMAKKMFSAFVREHNPDEVISYADRRWSQGNLYRQLGFVEEDGGSPGYFYVDCNRIKRFHRMKAMKHKIEYLVEDGATMSERDIMLELGYEVIYDCGSYRFCWHKP